MTIIDMAPHPSGTATPDDAASAPQHVQDLLAKLHAHIAHQDTLIADLQASTEQAQQQLSAANDSHAASVDQHRADIATIGEKLIEEAEDRQWCDDYDAIVEDLNRRLTARLPVREKDYEVDVNIVVTITVSAGSEDDAEDEAAHIVNAIESSIDERPSCSSDPESRGNWHVRRI